MKMVLKILYENSSFDNDPGCNHDQDTERSGNDLSEGCLMPLPVGERANVQLELAFRIEAQTGSFFFCPGRVLKISAHADAAASAGCSCLLFAPLQTGHFGLVRCHHGQRFVSRRS